MSWQPYVDDSLVGSGHIQKAAIIGIEELGDGTKKYNAWARSPGFDLSEDEMKAIANAIDSKDSRDKAYSSGLQLAGEQYAVIQIDEKEKVVLLRCKVAGKEKHGACIGKANQCIVVGYYDGNTVQAGNANATVQALVEYLKKAGF